MTTVSERVQQPAPGVEVDVYDLDLTSKGGTIRRFTNWTTETGGKIRWRGNNYDPIAMEVKGYAVDGSGKPVRPRMKLGNGFGGGGADYLPGDLTALCASYGYFIGCPVTRWRIFRENLDDGSDPSPSTHFPTETYVVGQMLEESFIYIEWELNSPIDQDGETLPKGIMTQKFCRFSYRTYDPTLADFNYNRVQCPYEAEGSGKYFTEADQPTSDPAQDACSHRRSGCRLRFGTKAPLPIRSFPGMTSMTRR